MYASSIAAKQKSRNAAGQRPSRSGYVNGGSHSSPARRQHHATRSAAARHGLSQAQTFPNRIVSGTRPSQKITQMNVGARFVPTERSPTSAAAKTTTKRPSPSAPRRTRSAAAGTRKSGRMPLALEARRPPERTERGEREHEHRRAAVVREPHRDRRVLDAADPVREREQRHGRTVSCAICLPRSSSSISKRPVSVALNRIRAGLPGATSAIRS